MFIQKVIFHVCACLKISFYRILYGKRLFIGKGTTFRKGFSLYIDKYDMGGGINRGKIQIGDHCFFNHYCSIVSFDSIQIGEGSIFGEGVKIYDHNHCYSDKNVPIKKQGYTTAPVVIGRHCWIGSNVIILKGVTIGDHCVIGAGCIIYKDVAADTIVINEQVHTTKAI